MLQKGQRQKSRGFTLVELMIVVVITAIGLALAVPSWRALVEKRQVTAAMESIASFITHAQSEAIKANEQVTVSWYSAGGHSTNWCVGAILGEDACDCRVTTSTAANFCTLNAVHTTTSPPSILTQSDFVKIGTEFFHTNSNLRNSSFGFDPVRGILTDLSANVGSEINANDYLFYVHSTQGSGGTRLFEMEFRINMTGRIDLCTDDDRVQIVAGYRKC